MKKFEFLEHTADIKFKAFGKTIEEMFENCVLAVSSAISGEIKIKPILKKKIEISGGDEKAILYELIDEIIYLMDAEDFIVAKSKIVLSGKKMTVDFYGDSTNNYKSLNHIKAATYSEMHIKKIKRLWEAQAVVDI